MEMLIPEEEPQTCPVCMETHPLIRLECQHGFCQPCLAVGFGIAIANAKVPLTCLQCDCVVSDDFTKKLFAHDSAVIERYDQFLLLRTLQTNPEVRFCPGLDCKNAFFCPPEKKLCPQIKCDACNTEFCYICRATWHPGQPCTFDMAANVKPCPQCNVAIYKEQDGSCNQMRCAVCKTEFCWLCLKKIDGLSGLTHFTSLSGCTMFGKERWSERKKQLWQLSSPLLVPVFLAGGAAAIPALVLIIPTAVGVDEWRNSRINPSKYRALKTGGLVVGSFLCIIPMLTVGYLVLSLKLISFAYIKMPYFQIRGLIKKKFSRSSRVSRIDGTNPALPPPPPTQSSI